MPAEPPTLLLASTSPHRRALLARLGLAFRAEAPGVDERPRPGEAAPALALRLALAKARAVAARHPQALVIGSDQVCEHGGALLGKPGTQARARAQLRRLAGGEARFLTAVALVWDGGAGTDRALDETRVRLRELDDDAIADYVARERPLDCAGAFRCEALGVALLERVRSDDPTALVGLPLIHLCTLLERRGVRVLARR